MANNEIPAYKVYLSDSTGLDTDVSAYIQPNWGSQELIAEKRLMQFQAGDLEFVFVDKGTDKTHRYWATRIAQSTSYVRPAVTGRTFDWPMIRVYDIAAPASEALFVGFVDKKRMVWNGNVFSSFKAVSQLAYMDTIDMYPIRNGVGLTGTVSELAATTVANALRKAGNETPDVAAYEVDVKDMFLGANPASIQQDELDWNHAARTEQNASVDPAVEYQLGDFVQITVAGHPERRGFIIKDGKLYRVDTGDRSAVTLTHIDVGSITEGYRLFRFVGDAGAECLCVVSAKARSSYAVQVQQNFTGTGKGAAQLGASALAFIPGWGWAAALGANLALEGAAALATKRNQVRNADQFWAITGVKILSVGDGTDSAVTGVGVAINRDLSEEAYKEPDSENSAWIWAHADSICTTQTNSTGTSPGKIWIAKWFSETRDYRLMQCYWNTVAGAWSVLSVAGTSAKQNGPPSGGMAASYALGAPAGYECIMVGVTNGFVLHTRTGNGEMWSKFHEHISPPGRFIGALPYQRSGSSYVSFVYGNGGITRVEKKALSTDDPTIENIATVYGGRIPTGIIAVGASPMMVNAKMAVPVIYSAMAATDDDEVQTYGGLVRHTDGATNIAIDTTYAVYPLPDGNGGDWRPPHIYRDTNQNGTYRMLAFCSRVSENYLLTDSYSTSAYAVLRVHHNFRHDRMTIRQFLEAITRSGWLRLRLYDDAKPASLVARKVMSRHQYDPPDAGDLSVVEVQGGHQAQPQVTGIEWYDGATWSAQGQEGDAGSVGVAARSTFTLGAVFLTPIWARGMAARIVSEYPETSAEYANGRRIFEVNIRKVNDDGDEVHPGYNTLYQYVTMSFFTNAGFAGTKGLIQSLGYSRQTHLFHALLLEWDDAGVDWTSNEPTAAIVEAAYPSEDTNTAVSAITASLRNIGWSMPHALVTMTAHTNPQDGPCAWAARIYMPHGLLLTAYGFGMTRLGVPTDGDLYFHLFTDKSGTIGSRLDNSKAVAVTLDTLAAGYHTVDLELVDSCWIDSGHYWLIVNIDRDDGNGIGPPPIDWLDAGAIGEGWGKRFPFWADTGLGTPDNGWLEDGDWNDTFAAASQSQPYVMMVGE